MKNIFIKIKFSLLIVLSLVLFYTTSAQNKQTFEAEAAVLSGTALVASCGNASGGEMVKGLDNGENNSVLFEKINVPDTAEYFITISYYATNDKTANYKVNGSEQLSESLRASGDWCYLGGTPGEYTFGVNLNKGDNSIKFYNSPIIDKIVISSDTVSRVASAIYISSTTGNDTNDGLTAKTAIQTLSTLNSIKLLPGDSVYFKRGDIFKGKLLISGESGSDGKPIIFSDYGDGALPLLDGDGNIATIHALNSAYLSFSNLEIKNNGGPAKPGDPEDVRYGIYFQNSYTDGTVFKHYRMNGLEFRNIYPTIEVTEDDNTGVNAHAIFTSGSWGDDINPLRFDDMQVTNCYLTRTARHALVIKSTNNLRITNNVFEHVGGAGMVVGNACSNILVENNITYHTGSSIDPRMAGRGSGFWCFRATNLTVQHNQFMYARGIHDSYGMHIDIGNRNVVFQYNYSVGNEGGFVEILGMNTNVGYRYNLSIADGWRKRGNRHGQIFWLAGWSGDPKNPVGSDSIFVYNNSIYVPDTITPGIWIDNVSKNARIYNNIIHVENEFGPVVINNNASLNDFDYNIWFGNIPSVDEDGEQYRGANALTSDPMYTDDIVTDSMGFILQDGSPAIGSGKLIYNNTISGSFDYFQNNGGVDYYGNSVSSSTPPNIGAYNAEGIEVGISDDLQFERQFNIYPNPIKIGRVLNIDGALHFHPNQISIEIIDVSGKIKFQKIYSDNSSINIDTSRFNPGIYFVKIQSNNSTELKKLSVH